MKINLFISFLTKIFTATMTVLLLHGCATTMESRVTTFHQLSQKDGGKSFVIKPEDSAQKTSIAFQTYAQIISKQLEEKGYQAAQANEAALLIRVNYRIDDGREVLQYHPIFHTRHLRFSRYSSDYYSGRRSYFSGWPPTSIRVYKTILTVKIFNKNPVVEKDKIALYEGTVINESANGDLAAVLPLMIKALFNDFPGNSGESKLVKVHF